MTWDVFVSHSSHDDDWVAFLAARLRREGLTVFDDRDSMPKGVAFEFHMTQAVSRSRCIVWAMSPEFFSSVPAMDEVATGWQLRKPFVPVLVRDTAVGGGPRCAPPHPFDRITWFDCRRTPFIDTDLDELARHIREERALATRKSTGESGIGFSVEVSERASNRRVAGVQQPRSLEEAFLRVRRAVAIVVEQGPAGPRRIGCVWLFRDYLLLCSPGVADRIASALEAKRAPQLCVPDAGQTTISAPIASVRARDLIHIGVVKAAAGVGLTRAALDWTVPGRPSSRTSLQFGVVVSHATSEPTRPRTTFARISVARWGDAAVLHERQDAVADGDPLFSAAGAIAGFIEKSIDGVRLRPLVEPILVS